MRGTPNNARRQLRVPSAVTKDMDMTGLATVPSCFAVTGIMIGTPAFLSPSCWVCSWVPKATDAFFDWWIVGGDIETQVGTQSRCVGNPPHNVGTPNHTKNCGDIRFRIPLDRAGCRAPWAGVGHIAEPWVPF